MSLLEATSVTVHFEGHDDRGRSRRWAAVDGVSVSVAAGERVGIIGESGSGKTTLAKALLGLETMTGGQVLFEGVDIQRLTRKTLERFRRGVQMVFQDPLGSLNPRLTVGGAMEEVLAVHKIVPRSERQGKVETLLRQVGLDPGYVRRYPHEFSGGQRQRVGIARALALSPKLLVADEPVSALDVSVQAQILNLIRDLSVENGMSVILVAHDLAVVNYVCDRVLIMYKGRVVEEGPTRVVFESPAHPYTRLLKAAVPDPGDIPGQESEVKPSASLCVNELKASSGCPFSPRCPLVQDACLAQVPALKPADGGRKVACLFAG